MLFYPKNGATHLVLIHRTSYYGVHSSQIAFPGGKPEIVDKNLEATALRETHEEIGIHPAIVAGMLRHEKDSYTIFNKIINKTNTRKLVFNHE